MFSRDLGLMANSVLTWIALAFYIITRPGLSSQEKVLTLPNDEGQEVPYTRISLGENAGCSAYVWQGEYRWICTNSPKGDDFYQAILPDSDGIVRFTVYYRFQALVDGMMAPEYNSPKYYQDYQVNPRNFPLLYTTYDGCLATPPGMQILLWNLGSRKIQPDSPKVYTGKPMQESVVEEFTEEGDTSQVPLKENTAALTPSPSFPDEYQLSSNPPDAGAPIETRPPSLPNQAENTNPGADSSGPLAANKPGSMDTALLGNGLASTDFTDSSLWNKHKRDPRAVNPRRKRVVLGEKIA